MSTEVSYLPQLLLLLQAARLGRIGDLDFVVVTGADSGLGDLNRALQIGPPHPVHVAENTNRRTGHLRPSGIIWVGGNS